MSGGADLRGLHLHVDCASGAAGDMMLGALLDLGVPFDAIGAALDAVGAGRGRLRHARVLKHGISAVNVEVDTTGHVLAAEPEAVPAPAPVPAPAATPGNESGSFVAIKFRAEKHERHVTVDEQGDKQERLHETPPGGTPKLGHGHGHAHGDGAGHGHAHGDGAEHAHGDGAGHGHGHGDGAGHGHGHGHGHYRYRGIRALIEQAPLTDGTRRRALDIFDRLARAEAKLHGTTVEDVVFHEVGAIDSIVDVVGTAAALDYLSPASVTCASVAMGHGTLRSAHGVLPVPAPAALEVLREASGVMTDGGVGRELCTPTGAAILAAAVTAWGPAPTGQPVAVGWGAGDAELDDRPNALRVVAIARSAATSDAVWQIDANLDDMNPELCGPAADAVFAAGALDVWWTPITMKKGRPALTLSALTADDTRDAVVSAILRETTTIGVRFERRERRVLARDLVTVDTAFGPIPIKVSREGNVVRNVAPEHDACMAAARAHSVPLKLVYAAALASWGRS
jgi:hypothetical protein